MDESFNERKKRGKSFLLACRQQQKYMAKVGNFFSAEFIYLFAFLLSLSSSLVESERE
jgi:hypothetical protein